MKLPDFTNFSSLNQLRAKMKAQLVEYAPTPKGAISFSEIDKLSRGELEISLDQIEIRPDGIFSFKGRAVIVHIPERDKKFHISDCDTIKWMKNSGRYERYIASERKDGLFNVRSESGKMNLIKLDVCMKCLREIKWDKRARSNQSGNLINVDKSSFSIKDFFSKYGAGYISQQPYFSSLTMPNNQYTDDWQEISKKIRQDNNFTCHKCGWKAEAPWERRQMEVHHINGVKGDNRPSNLQCLCHDCHAQQPLHSHMPNASQGKKIRSLDFYSTKKRKRRRY